MSTNEDIFMQAFSQSGEDQEQAEAQRIIAGDQPLMAEPTDPWLKLPRGLREGDRWDTDAVVRELTGADEEALAKYRQDPILLLDAVVAYGVDSIGPTNLAGKTFDQRTEVLRNLLIGEREQLFLAVAKATFGDEKEMSYGCPHCGATNDITISLTENITFKEMKEPQRETYEYTTSKNQKVTYRLVNGADQFDLYARSTGIDMAQQNTLILADVLVSVDDRPVVDPKNFVRSLGMRDRALLLDLVVGAQPSPDLTLTTECPSCKEDVTLPLTWELVFRP